MLLQSSTDSSNLNDSANVKSPPSEKPPVVRRRFTNAKFEKPLYRTWKYAHEGNDDFIAAFIKDPTGYDY